MLDDKEEKYYIIYAMQFMVQIVVRNIIQVISTRIPQNSLCEKERQKIHDGRGNTLSVGKDKINGSTILSSWYLQLTTGIDDDARIPCSEGMIIERHRALLVVGDVDES